MPAARRVGIASTPFLRLMKCLTLSVDGSNERGGAPAVASARTLARLSFRQLEVPTAALRAGVSAVRERVEAASRGLGRADAHARGARRGERGEGHRFLA